MATGKQIVLIGGSAGSLPVVASILKQLPAAFALPIVIILHRQRNVKSEMQQILNSPNKKKIIEPDDKEPVHDFCIYLAPQNYHLLIEPDFTFSLDYSETVRYSRPSIDVAFDSAAMVYGAGAIAILLSGANNDGAEGLKAILHMKGVGIVQDPATAEYAAMPKAGVMADKKILVMTPGEILNYLVKL